MLNPKGNAIPMLTVPSKHEIAEPNHNFDLMKLGIKDIAFRIQNIARFEAVSAVFARVLG